MAADTQRRARRASGYLVLLLLVIAVGLGVFFRQNLTDFYRASTFDPSPRIVDIAENMELSDSGERVFFATHPTIQGNQGFSEQCSAVDHSEDGHLLGCYSEDRIRLFEVNDDRIGDIVEVTAAHELLHASYARLRSWERQELQQRLIAVYEELAEEDEELRERMSVYEHLSASRFANEIHSVLGTEVADLPHDLEEHYSQWFLNRAGVVEGFESFRGVFDDLQNEVDSLREEMETLREAIELGSAEYGEAVELFNADVQDFNSRNERYEFSDAPEEFEFLRNGLSERRDELEEVREGLQSDISRYNKMRDRLLQLGEVGEELDQKLDASLAPL